MLFVASKYTRGRIFGLQQLQYVNVHMFVLCWYVSLYLVILEIRNIHVSK